MYVGGDEWGLSIVNNWWLVINCSKELFWLVLLEEFCGGEALKSINNKSSTIVGRLFGTGGGGRVINGLFLFELFNWRILDTTKI